MTGLATLITGALLGAGGTWLFTRTRRGATTVTTTPMEDAAATAKRRWQMPAFRRTQAATMVTPAATLTPDAAVEAMPAVNDATVEAGATA